MRYYILFYIIYYILFCLYKAFVQMHKTFMPANTAEREVASTKVRQDFGVQKNAFTVNLHSLNCGGKL